MKSIQEICNGLVRWARKMGLLKSPFKIEPHEGATNGPLKRILEVMAQAVPELPHDKFTVAERTIAEASVYVTYQRIPQAIAILRELDGDKAIDAAWLGDLIWCLEAAMLMPGNDIESFDRRIAAMRTYRKIEIERLMEQAKQLQQDRE